MPPNDPIKASNRFFDTMRAAPSSCSSIYPLKGNENGGHKVGQRFLSKKERTISTGPLGIKNKVSRPLFTYNSDIIIVLEVRVVVVSRGWLWRRHFAGFRRRHRRRHQIARRCVSMEGVRCPNFGLTSRLCLRLWSFRAVLHACDSMASAPLFSPWARLKPH
jgi:hypothetical protein